MVNSALALASLAPGGGGSALGKSPASVKPLGGIGLECLLTSNYTDL